MKALTFAAAALLLCMPAAAQTYGGGNSQTQGNDRSERSTAKKSGTSPRTITGCLTENNGKYMLTNKDHPAGIEITSPQDLKTHVGHTVTVMGMMQNSNGASPADSGNATSDKNRDANKMPSMQVSSLKTMSTTCSTNNTGVSGNAEKDYPNTADTTR